MIQGGAGVSTGALLREEPKAAVFGRNPIHHDEIVFSVNMDKTGLLTSQLTESSDSLYCGIYVYYFLFCCLSYLELLP